MCTLDVPALGKTIKVTDYDKTEPGQQISFTVRPEKVRITLEEPHKSDRELNVFRGIVEEPVYSGFQSKFFVKLDNGTELKVFKQHQNYLEDGPEIAWKDTVYVSWSANDGYIVEVINQ
jgi:spermidine/putrescine transport system ATP-binding protein